MSKVDPTHFKTLDRRTTILLQATQNQTEAVEEKSLSAVEEPGIDALRGSFGTIGSIIRARSARHISQSSHSTGQSSRFGFPSSRFDAERGDSKSSPFATNLGHYGGMKRHQLFDPPVPRLGVPESDAISLSSQPSARKPAISFGEQDVVHSYHRGTVGKDDMATHERRAAPHGSSPLASPRSLVQPSFLPEGSNDSRQQQQQSPVATGFGSPPKFGLGLDEPRSAPAGVGVARGDYRDPFEGAPATATLPAIPSIASLDDDVETGRRNRRTYSRQGSSRDYPKGDRVDDAEERVSLWDPRREDSEEMDAAASPESSLGTVRLVGSSRPGRF
jgi:magnesium transporter